MAGDLNAEQLFQKYFVDARTYIFETITHEKNFEYQFKRDISEVLDVHINDIYIIGSGKTGFCMKPKEYGREFDKNYHATNLLRNKSDVDVAIVSLKLFHCIQESVYDFTKGYRKSWSNVYHVSGKDKHGIALKYKFLEYLGKGWYRPDFAPKNYKIETKNGALQETIEKWRSKLGRKVSYGVYMNWHFFKKYQLENIEKVMREINSGEML